MMLTGSSSSPFAAIESAIYRALFAGYSPYAALTEEATKGRADGSASVATKESSKKGAADAPSPSPVVGQALKAKEESERPEPGSRKKAD